MDLEWLLLADSAQVVDNKLYLLGGGWDMLTVTTGFPAQKQVAVAAAFLIPWQETNQHHTVEIEINAADGGILARVGGHLAIGRPVGIPVGHSQRFQLPLEALLTFDHPGTYVVTARIAGREAGRTTFNVLSAPR